MQEDRLYVKLGETAPRPFSIAFLPTPSSFVYSQSIKWTGPQLYVIDYQVSFFIKEKKFPNPKTTRQGLNFALYREGVRNIHIEFSLVQQAVHSLSSLSVNQHTQELKLFEDGPARREKIYLKICL